MYKPYSDSYLMTKSKKTLIEYIRIAEHNQRVCEETIDQQAKNCIELLKKERADAIADIVPKAFEWLMAMDIIDCDGCDYTSECPNRNMNCFDVMAEKFLEQLKEEKMYNYSLLFTNWK